MFYVGQNMKIMKYKLDVVPPWTLQVVLGNFKKMAFFTFFPNLIKIKKFQEQLISLKGDYDGHFFAQGYFGSQSLHRKKSFNFLCRNGQDRSVTLFFTMKIGNPFLPS